MAETARQTEGAVRSVTRTTCVVVGDGPGGAVLALLLARKGVDVALLEAQIQRRILAPALRSSEPFSPPLPLRLLPRIPMLRNLPGRLIGYGLWPSRVR